MHDFRAGLLMSNERFYYLIRPYDMPESWIPASSRKAAMLLAISVADHVDSYSPYASYRSMEKLEGEDELFRVKIFKSMLDLGYTWNIEHDFISKYYAEGYLPEGVQ